MLACGEQELCGEKTEAGAQGHRRGHRGAVVVVRRTWVRAGHPQEMLSKPWTEKGPGKAPREAGAAGTGRRPRY